MFTKKINLAWAMAAFLALMTIPGSAQSDTGNGGGIEGTWEVTVNLINPPSGFPSSFKALETYSRGGGMVTSNNMFPNSGQGSWENNGNDYTITLIFFTFDQNGLSNGSIKVRHSLGLNGKNNYSGTGVAEFRDAFGQVLFTVPFTTAGAYLVPEAP